jgi:hypothetical protein
MSLWLYLQYTWVLDVYTQIKLKYMTSHYCIIYIIIWYNCNNQPHKLCYEYLYVIPILQLKPTTTTTRSILKRCKPKGYNLYHSWR